MTLYIGVDIHARQQTLSYLDTSDGTTGQIELSHERVDIREFYSKILFIFDVVVWTQSEVCGNLHTEFESPPGSKRILQYWEKIGPVPGK